MPSCSPFKSNKSEKKNEIEDLKYYLDNTLSRTDDILNKHKSIIDGSDVQNPTTRRSIENLNSTSTYNSIYSNITSLDNYLKTLYEKYESMKRERDDLRRDYNSLFQEKSDLFEKYEELESEVINLRHNNLVLDYQKNPLKKDKVEELEDNYVDLYGTYKRTIRESKSKMEEMRNQYERNSEEQKEKINDLKRQLQNMKNIQEEFGEQVKKMGVEFQEKEEIMVQVIQKLQEENKKLKEEQANNKQKN